MSDDLIIRSLKKTNKAVDLSTADMVKLKQAGVSDNVIGIMLDPSAAPAPAAAAAPPPAPRPRPRPCQLQRPLLRPWHPRPLPLALHRKPKRNA